MDHPSEPDPGIHEQCRPCGPRNDECLVQDLSGVWRHPRTQSCQRPGLTTHCLLPAACLVCSSACTPRIAKRPTYNPWAGLSCRTGLATLEQTSIVWASVSPSIMRACLIVLKLAGPRPRIDVASGIFLPFLVRIESHRIVGGNPPESGLDWIGLRHPFHSHSHSPSPSRSASPAHPHPAPPRPVPIALHRRPPPPPPPPLALSSGSPPTAWRRQADRYSGAVTKRDRSRCPRKEAARRRELPSLDGSIARLRH
ncbi:hypothetical protein PVAP13_9NG560300 [Panicum virgatum]|uniref:Uncharacterized protein n=1 Tax=Panicum virgatum TaxID=38727 RepID=A0A8T0MZW5_PANVG|nr:hypothetical protein PVAP13_9NG560300 [Panicum virgatum]